MSKFSRSHIFPAVIVLIIAACIICICALSGFRHETEKFKTMLLTLLVVLLLSYVVGDAIMLTLEALLITCCQRLREGEPRFPPGITRPHSYTENLRQRLLSLKGNYRLPWKHRDERLNKFYAALKNELFVYLAYFVVLLTIVAVTRDELIYYNTDSKRLMFENPAISSMGIRDVSRLRDIYSYIKISLIDGFHEGVDYNNKPIAEPGWLNYEMAKLVGVVRLRQMRYGDNSKRYLPGWQEPYVHYHYLRKYWRIYGPWLPLDYDDHDEIKTDIKRMRTKSNVVSRSRQRRSNDGELDQQDEEQEVVFDRIKRMKTKINIVSRSRQRRAIEGDLDQQEEEKEVVFDRAGELNDYSEYGGYETVLARNIQNSLTVAQFLERYGWLDANTAALFVDFTLFNVDANMFTVVNILMEQTPFGDIIYNIRVNSCRLLLDLNGLSYGGIILVALYLFVLVLFVQALGGRLWQQGCRYLNGWSLLDILIVLLNIIIVPLIVMRERRVRQLLKLVDEQSKLRFVDFRGPAQLDYLVLVLVGCLICLSTLRLWRIMQFARVFRLFTNTLNLAKWPMLSSMIFIGVVLWSFSISSCIINGSQSASFSEPMKSIRAGMSVAIGVGNNMGPQELSYGGITLGMLQYTILMIMVAIVLINMFVTLIIDYFTVAKAVSEQEKLNRLNFIEFLAMDYAWVWHGLRRMVARCCCCWRRRRERTIKQRMEAALDDLDGKRKKQRQDDEADNDELNAELKEANGKSKMEIKHELHMRRLQQLADILRTQMSLISRELMLLDVEEDWDDEAMPAKPEKHVWLP